MFFQLIIAALLTTAATAAFTKTPVSVNDVSILLDLPTQAEGAGFLLSADSSGVKGELLPKKYFSEIHPLIAGVDQIGDLDFEYDKLKVIGLRFDPCFQFDVPLPGPGVKCDFQLRLVWQPVVLENGKYTTLDGALHSFYRLTTEQFNQVLNEVQSLTSGLSIATKGLPLGVHPGYLNISTRKVFNESLKSILLKNIGNRNLIRVTFMKMLTKTMWWEFGGLDIQQGEAKKIDIPRYPKGQFDQHFFQMDFFTTDKMRGTLTPELSDKVVTEDNFSEIIRGYSYHLQPSHQEARNKAFIVMEKILNPRIHSAASVDCVHCHVASQSKAWLLSKDSSLSKFDGSIPESFKVHEGQKPYLRNTSPMGKDIKSLRMFGYFGRSPSISQRTINESIEVMNSINKTK